MKRLASGALGLVLLLVLLPFVALAVPLLMLGAWWQALQRRRLQRAFHARWGSQGKRLLLVYSSSPNWQTYIEHNWLPRLASVAVVLNWSERGKWSERHQLEAKIFRAWAGEREFNPLAIAIPPKGPVRVIRLWRAFRDYRHGKDHSLRLAEADLGEVLGISLQAGA